MTDRSPCLTVPLRVMPVGARFLCVAALLLIQLLDWVEARRRCR